MSKRAIIIGASSGMGYQIALILASKGWIVGVAGRRLNLLDELKSHFPDKIFPYTIDSCSDDSDKRLKELIEIVGGMDLFINSAGIGSQNHDLDIETEVGIEMTNVVGFSKMICSAYNYFRDRETAAAANNNNSSNDCCNNGSNANKNCCNEKNNDDSCNNNNTAHIVAITSIAGTKGLGASPAYSATKRFQNIYLDCLEQLSHMQKINIKFTDIRPGFVSTALLGDNHHYPMQMDVRYTAERIVKAIEKGRRVAVIDWKYSIIVFFWRLIPRWIWARLPIKTKDTKLQ